MLLRPRRHAQSLTEAGMMRATMMFTLELKKVMRTMVMMTAKPRVMVLMLMMVMMIRVLAQIIRILVISGAIGACAQHCCIQSLGS